MNVKQIFCKHNWERQTIQLTNISIIYLANSPIKELRTYTVMYFCNKCKGSEAKEIYAERDLSSDEKELLVKESYHYAEIANI